MIKNTEYKFNRLVMISVAGLALGLSGCGGGGGDSSTAPTNVTGVTIGGTAAKGIVKAGVVTAKQLNVSGDAIATVGSATTAADGSYSLTLNNNYTGGPIQISITADANTETKCDVPAGCGTRTDGLTDTINPTVIDFGEWYKPAALNMTALVPDAKSNEKLSVSVTPFTHMAAARAKAGATLDVTTVAKANSEVSNLLGGIDILNTPPVDITDSVAVNDALSETHVTYAALASALSNQGLVDADGQPDLNTAIDLLASAFTSGVIEADDSDGDDAAQISLQEIVTAAEETFTEAGITDVTGVMANLQSDITTAEAGDGTIDPEPSNTIADPNLDKVKAMVSDVRTWGNVIVAETEARGSAFKAQVVLASDAIVIFGTADPVDVLDASIEAALNFTSGNADISSYVLGLNTFASGTIDSPTPGVITITNGVVHGYTVNITINMPEDGTIARSFALGIVSATITSPNNHLTINNGLANVTFATDYTVDYAAINLGTTVLPKATDLTFDLENVAFTQNVDSSGVDLASPVTFEGALSTDLDVIPVINNPLDDMALPKTFNLTGVISNTLGDSVTVTLAVNVTNTATFQFVGDAYPVGTLYSTLHSGEPMIQWAYTDTDSILGDDTFTYTTLNGSQSYYWGAVNTSNTNTFTYTNYYTNLSDLVANNVYIWNNSAYEAEGEYFFDSSGADLTVNGSLGDGVLVYSNDEINFPSGTTLYSDNHAPTFYWTYTDTDAITGNDTFTYTYPDGSQNYYWNAADNSITQSNTYTYPTYEASLADVMNNNFYPYDAYTSIDGEGSYVASVAGADFSVDGEVVGVLVEPDYIEETNTANGWIDADIGLSFIVQLAGLPEASINITADRTGFEAGNGQVTISYGNRQLTLSGSLSNSRVDGNLTITNHDNVVLSFTDSNINVDTPSLSGVLKLNGVEYGTLTETDSGYLKTTYIDGTFEIF